MRFHWVLFLVVAVLTLIAQIAFGQTDLRVVAVGVVQPDFVMHDLAQLSTAHLADSTVEPDAPPNVRISGAPPRAAFVKFFLRHILKKALDKCVLNAYNI